MGTDQSHGGTSDDQTQAENGTGSRSFELHSRGITRDDHDRADGNWLEDMVPYRRYASFISMDPDRSTTIYRRFEKLSARNLLYLESELSEMEQELEDLDNLSDINQDNASVLREMEDTSHSWTGLRQQAEWAVINEEVPECTKKHVQECAKKRVQLVKDIREKLKEYQEALKLCSEIIAMNAPRKGPLEGAREIFRDNAELKFGSDLIEDALSKHLDVETHELCVLARPQDPDRLTRLLEGPLASLGFRVKKYAHGNDPSEIVSHRRVEVTVAGISTVLSAAFLIGAVLGLYFLKASGARLGLISGLMIFFAGSLALMTNARRQDVFAATAAYAAVLVVFVSGDFAGTSPSTSYPSGNSTATTMFLTKTVTTALSPALPTVDIMVSSPSAAESSENTFNLISGIVSIVFAVLASMLALLVLLNLHKRRSNTTPEEHCETSGGRLPPLST